MSAPAKSIESLRIIPRPSRGLVDPPFRRIDRFSCFTEFHIKRRPAGAEIRHIDARDTPSSHRRYRLTGGNELTALHIDPVHPCQNDMIVIANTTADGIYFVDLGLAGVVSEVGAGASKSNLRAAPSLPHPF